MTRATHQAKDGRRLAFVSFDHKGNAIFNDLDAAYPCRVTCPLTREYVAPYVDRSSVGETHEPEQAAV